MDWEPEIAEISRICKLYYRNQLMRLKLTKYRPRGMFQGGKLWISNPWKYMEPEDDL